MPTRLTRGIRVGERYRLDRELGRGDKSVTWEALDERLDRAVALRMFDPGLDRKELVNRAGIAASLTHPRVVRVFDTGQDEGRFFTVSELLPASLRSVRLPLSTDNALATAIDCAEALQYAHERGVIHGNLHEGNVLLSESGAKVADFALGGQQRHRERSDDLRELGAMLRRVTDEPSPNVPDGFTRVVEGLANGAYGSATEALNELRNLRPTAAIAPPQTPGRRGWLIIVVALLIAVVAFGVTRLGGRSSGTHFVQGGRITGTPLRVVSVDDFDPPPGDGHEQSRTVGNVNDPESTTFWTTERYVSSPFFSGRKKGVGVIFDMGSPVEVGKAQVLFTTAGCSYEIRYSANNTAPVLEWPTASIEVTDAPVSSAIVFGSTQKAQYFLLWITKLTRGVPGAGKSWACGVKDVKMFAP